MQLTHDNYHGGEPNRAYFSASQISAWKACPAKTYATLSLGWKECEAEQEKARKRFLGGQYAHCYFLEPHKLADFTARNPEVKKAIEPTAEDLKHMALDAGIELKGAMSSKAAIIKRMTASGYEFPPPVYEFATDYKGIAHGIAAMERQPVFMELILRGDHEVILTGEIGGYPFKVAIDNLRPEDRQFDDLKFMADFEDKWSDDERRRVEWFELYHYPRQMAIYREIIRQNYGVPFVPNILGATKQEPGDVDWLQFRDQYALDHEIAKLRQELPIIAEWKSGEQEPPRCGKPSCSYCRETKTITMPRIPSAR